MIRLLTTIILLGLFTILPGWLFAQEFDVPITLTDGTNTQVLTIGVDPSGTDGYDSGLDVFSPPLPPAGAFGTVLKWMNEQYYTDIRDNTTEEKTFVMRYQAQTGGAIVLSWDSASLSSLGSFQIVDDITGGLFSLDMTTTNSLEISSSPYITDKLRIVVNTDPAGIDDLANQIADSYFLAQNYPNPFNPKTIINYELPMTNFVDLSIYNMLGQKVATLISERQSAGIYKVEWAAVEFANGVYYYYLKAGEFQDVKKMMLIK